MRSFLLLSWTLGALGSYLQTLPKGVMASGCRDETFSCDGQYTRKTVGSGPPQGWKAGLIRKNPYDARDIRNTWYDAANSAQVYYEKRGGGYIYYENGRWLVC